MNEIIRQQTTTNQDGMLFENQIAHHLQKLNDELLSNINSQATLLVGLIQMFQFIDFNYLKIKEQKRITALEAWSRDILENINSFHLGRLRKITPKLADEIYTVSELKSEFDNIVYFMTYKMELEEAATK